MRELDGAPWQQSLLSHIAADGDAAVVKTITSVRARGIVVVIAHRPSALGAVDLNLMMEEGRMMAFGPDG